MSLFRYFIPLACLVLFVSSLSTATWANTPPTSEPRPHDHGEAKQVDVYGVVTKIEDGGTVSASQLFNPQGQKDLIQKVTIRLDIRSRLPGLKKNVIEVENVISGNPAYNIPLKPGARVVLTAERQAGNWIFYINNRDRTPTLMILGALFVLAILLIGGPEVSKHALLATVMLMGVYKAFFPAVLAGSGGLLWVMLMCFMFTILGSFIYKIPGTGRAFSRQQLIVILGTSGALLILALILAILHGLMPLNGYVSEALASLWFTSPKLDTWALYVGTVLIGYQGFAFYLCWMLAQNRKDPNEVLSFRERFDIVMLRGRRLLGPMLSSLGLLFIGLYLPILLQMQGTSTAQFMNLESTASMLVIAFAGGLTLILTVPLTALLAAWLLTDVETKPQ